MFWKVIIVKLLSQYWLDFTTKRKYTHITPNAVFNQLRFHALQCSSGQIHVQRPIHQHAKHCHIQLAPASCTGATQRFHTDTSQVVKQYINIHTTHGMPFRQHFRLLMSLPLCCGGCGLHVGTASAFEGLAFN